MSLAISPQGHRVTEKTNGFLKSFFDHVYPVPLGEWILSLNLEAERHALRRCRRADIHPRVENKICIQWGVAPLIIHNRNSREDRRTESIDAHRLDRSANALATVTNRMSSEGGVLSCNVELLL